MSLRRKLENLFTDIDKIETTVGEKWILNNEGSICIIGECEEGLVYKNNDAYKNSLHEICYIPENYFELYYEEVDQILNEYIDGKISEENLYRKLNETEFSYSHKDILKLCNNQEEIADKVFHSLTWQKPETIIEKMYINKDLANYKGNLVLTNGLSLDDFLATQDKIYIFDEEIVVDKNSGIIDAYLWATDELVRKLEHVTKLDSKYMDNINFYALYNVTKETMELESTFYYIDEANEEIQMQSNLPLSTEEQDMLKDALEEYCVAQEGLSCKELYEKIFMEERGTTLDHRLNIIENRNAFHEEVINQPKKDIEFVY